MNSSTIKITPRPVSFNFDQSSIHWIPNDPFSSHTYNAINLLLPAGEFWFCRVFNKALGSITDPQLADDVKAFIRQEAIHARAHIVGQKFMQDNDYDLEKGLKTAETIFGQLLADRPFNLSIFNNKWVESNWLIARVGIIAAIEHFTGVIGQWTLDESGNWDKNNADPEMSDLF